jgi:hypothetical protein
MKTQRLTCKEVVLLTLFVLGLTPLSGQVPLSDPVERDASVVYVPLDISFFSIGNFVERHFDLNEDGIDDFRFTNGGLEVVHGISVYPLSQNRVIGSLVQATPYDTEEYLIPFKKGSQISGTIDQDAYKWTKTAGWKNERQTVTGCAGTGIIQEPVACGDFFYNQGVSYMGLELDLEGQKHYGWLLMDFTFLPFSGCEFLSYAYETEPGVAIMTGEIPEPSTYALWVGVLSALALVIQKRFKTLK